MPFEAPPLPPDAALCAGDTLDAANLRQLLRVALPDKGRHKAAGWFGQTDFLLTRSHVDEEGDVYHDALFITQWQRWDFWLALPPRDTPGPLGRAWARLRGAPPPAPAAELERQYRRHDGSGLPSPWLPLDAEAPQEAWQACTEGWQGVLRYWRLAEAQRLAGRPLRAQLHATLTSARLMALVQLPLPGSQRLETGEGEAWASTPRLQPHSGRALWLEWPNAAAQDAAQAPRACYQIEHADSGSTAHPPGVRISYRQREGDLLELLPNDAVEHTERLLRLFTTLEQQSPAQNLSASPAPTLTCTPPVPTHATDAEVFGPDLMALSRDWQAAGRAHATVVRELWAAHPEDGPPPLADPRARYAAEVLQLARTVHAQADAGLSERFHHRFAFAAGAYAAHAQRHGQAVHALRWNADGSLLAWADRCWHVSADGLRITPAEGGAPSSAPPQATLHGTTIVGDADGNLRGLAEGGAVLWHHHVGCGAVLCLATAADDALAVGTAGGALVLLRRGPRPDAHQYGTSRHAEMRRILFWADAALPLAW